MFLNKITAAVSSFNSTLLLSNLVLATVFDGRVLVDESSVAPLGYFACLQEEGILFRSKVSCSEEEAPIYVCF